MTGAINLDQTPPTVAINGANNGANYPFDQQPTVSCATTDALSGVATPAHLTLTANATGTFTATCSGAADIAGNQTPDHAITYTVVPTAASLTTLTSQYISSSGAPNSNGITHKLANQLTNGDICGYIASVQQESTNPHPALTPQRAAELIYWARILDPNCG